MHSPTGRPGRLTAPIAAAAAAMPATLAGVALNADLVRGGLLNPDSAMRMARLHDILDAGAPLHAVLRDGGGAGTVLHWSHALDGLLLLLAAPAAAVAGWPAALHGAALLAGPLVMAALGWALAWAAAPYSPRGWGWVGAAAAGAAPCVAGYGMTGVVHHHVLLAVGAVMAGGWALRLLRGHDPVAGGLALGAWAGAGLWLSPESLPFSLMAIVALWLFWLVPGGRSEDQALPGALAWSGTGFALVTVLAVLADPPAGGPGAVEADRISLPFAVLAVAAMAVGWLPRLGAGRLPSLFCGVAAAAAWLLLFPQVLRGTEALIPPEVVAAMFDGIQEMQPVRTLSGAAEALGSGLFAVAVLTVLAVRRPGVLPVYLVACAAGLVALGALHVRFATYPTVAGAALLPLAVGWAERRVRSPPLQSLARLALVLPMLLVPMLAPAAGAATEAGGGAPCRGSGAVALLAGHGDAVVLSDVNLVPELLYHTENRTVGSLFHRSPGGFMRLRAAWREVPDELGPGPALRGTGATLLLACPGAPRPVLLEGLPRTTLLDRVERGRPPAWLRELGRAGGFVLFAVPS